MDKKTAFRHGRNAVIQFNDKIYFSNSSYHWNGSNLSNLEGRFLYQLSSLCFDRFITLISFTHSPSFRLNILPSFNTTVPSGLTQEPSLKLISFFTTLPLCSRTILPFILFKQ